jgi:hypothetical protein
VRLVAAIGYTFRGVWADEFIHTGAAAVTNPGDSGAVRIAFPATAAAAGPIIVYDTILTGHISRPIEGVTPVKGIAGSQYTGTVAWTPAHSTFQKGTAYTAVLNLKAISGYTFAGIGQNVFTHGDAPGAVTNAGGSGTVIISFPPAASSANPAMTFGPVEREGSALWMLNEKRDYIYPLAIELPGGPEDIFTGATLVASDTSPAEVIVNGNGRVVSVKTPGALLTVGGGVTLTLRNITFRGTNANTTPLFKVWPGGKLILEEGVAFVDNQTAADAGGVWVNGGILILNDGVVIKGMEAQRGGGVLIDANGKFYMNGGTIGGALSADGNTVSGENAGGGVLVSNGFFNMYNGTIQSNGSDNNQSGGGVCVLDGGTFNQFAGSIKGNTARGINSGGGVCVIGSAANFVMNDAVAIIEENTARGINSGGGLYLASGVFIINRGTIKKNTARESSSGGGLYITGDGGMSGVNNLVMNRGTILENIALAENSGGGMYIGSGASSLVLAVDIKQNTAQSSGSGGGVYVYGGGNLRLEAAAVVENNTAEAVDSGGGVCINGGTCESNGTIKNNTALAKQSGGGVYVALDPLSSYYSFTNGGTIKGNKALYSGPGSDADSGSGGGVCINGGYFTNLGIIGGENPATDANTAAIGANGVYVAGGQFRLSKGKITGNTAAGTQDYGVYIKDVSLEAFYIETAWDTDDVETLPQVTPDNRVFLSPGATISFFISNSRPQFAALLANITCAAAPISYKVNAGQATKFLSSSRSFSTTNIDMCKDRFLYNGASVNITGAVLDGNIYYGYYNE